MQFNRIGLFTLLIMTISLTACQINPEAYRPVDPAPGTLLADRAGGTVFLDEDDAPNPVGVKDITARSERYVPRHFTDLDGDCEGFVARQPAMTIHTGRELAAAKLTVSGDTDFLVIEGPRGTTCLVGDEIRQVDIEDWPQGRYRFYAGTTERYARFTYDLVFEDLNRAMTLPWMDDESLLHIEGIGQLDAPVHHSLSLKRIWANSTPAVRPDSDCLSEGFKTDHLPRARLSLSQDTSLTIAALSSESLELLLVGPITEGGREFPVSCTSDRAESLTASAGDYFLFFATSDENIPSTVDLVVTDDSADFEPTFLATQPDSGLAASARAASRHFPFISSHRLWHSDQLRSQLYAQAPRELFVALADRPDDARLYLATDRDSGYRYRAIEEGQSPRTGEVGLFIERRDDRAHFLSADGLIFAVSPDLLVPADKLDEMSLPENPRVERLELTEALSLAGRDDRELINRYQQNHEEYDQCVDDIFEEIDDELTAMREDPQTSQADVDEFIDETEQRARQECDYSSLTASDAEILEGLRTARTDRRQKILNEHRDRLQQLFE